MVDSLCDPDYINQTLLNYLTYREALAKQSNLPGSGYRYAATYEGNFLLCRSVISNVLCGVFLVDIYTSERSGLGKNDTFPQKPWNSFFF